MRLTFSRLRSSATCKGKRQPRIRRQQGDRDGIPRETTESEDNTFKWFFISAVCGDESTAIFRNQLKAEILLKCTGNLLELLWFVEKCRLHRDETDPAGHEHSGKFMDCLHPLFPSFSTLMATVSREFQC